MSVAAGEALADHIAGRRDDLIALVRALVAEQSVRGHEEPVQRIVEERLRRIGFATERVDRRRRGGAGRPLRGLPVRVL